MLPQQFHATRHVGIAGARVCGTPEAHRGRCRAEYVRMLWCVVALEAGLVVHVHLLHRTRTMARVLVVIYIVRGARPVRSDRGVNKFIHSSESAY